MTAGITLAVLGVPDVRLAGAPVVLPAKSLALVVYLAISGKRAFFLGGVGGMIADRCIRHAKSVFMFGFYQG